MHPMSGSMHAGGYGYDASGFPTSVAHPNLGGGGPGGQGAPYSVYPTPGSRPLSPHSPYSPYSFGGYDPFGHV